MTLSHYVPNLENTNLPERTAIGPEIIGQWRYYTNKLFENIGYLDNRAALIIFVDDHQRIPQRVDVFYDIPFQLVTFGYQSRDNHDEIVIYHPNGHGALHNKNKFIIKNIIISNEKMDLDEQIDYIKKCPDKTNFLCKAKKEYLFLVKSEDLITKITNIMRPIESIISINELIHMLYAKPIDPIKSAINRANTRNW